MKSYIIDTNLFFNMEAALGLGETTADIVKNIVRAVQKAPDGEVEIVVPPTIVQEITSFFDSPDDPLLKSLFGSVTVKSPRTSEQSVSAVIIERLIEDYRDRAYRAMKVAEEEIIHTAEMFMGKEVLPHKEFQIACGKILTKLRERYRNATRTGTIDSKADFDLIMLAKELDGYLVTTDEGVTYWARLLGVKEMSSSVFGKKMQEYL
ncbi:RNA ligase partner protein [Candidatus Roizmanbacteria bacterium]|nr:MAG: RNA ligase partner protein [Candidatus Roizmanbacteria bacterium]